ncbi:MAG TPA: sigma-70 family RNA polymerase sigma factor [Kofleriaceae bacterium]|nr:sigma-70 family RNA polymerase sigma factor [Kofleriaceae bacterium]
MTDAQLVAQALAGDARAFGALVTRTRDVAVAVAFAATGDVGLAEDLAQEAFVIAWRRLGSLAHRERFGPWLCGIVRHVAQSDRRHRRRHAPGGTADPLEAIAAAHPSPLDEVIARQSLARTWRALRALPARYREPLVLYCRLDHSHARVAESLGLSEEAVRQRVSRARQKLRDEVDGVERHARAARGPTAAGVIALIWSRSARAATAPASPWLLAVAAPLAAVAAAIVITSAALTASRALAAGEVAAPPAAPPAAARPSHTRPPAPRPSVELGAGAVDRSPVELTVAVVEPTDTVPPRRGRVVRHGPAVVMPDEPRPLLRPTLEIDPASLLP